MPFVLAQKAWICGCRLCLTLALGRVESNDSECSTVINGRTTQDAASTDPDRWSVYRTDDGARDRQSVEITYPNYLDCKREKPVIVWEAWSEAEGQSMSRGPSEYVDGPPDHRPSYFPF